MASAPGRSSTSSTRKSFSKVKSSTTKKTTQKRVPKKASQDTTKLLREQTKLLAQQQKQIDKLTKELSKTKRSLASSRKSASIKAATKEYNRARKALKQDATQASKTWKSLKKLFKQVTTQYKDTGKKPPKSIRKAKYRLGKADKVVDKAKQLTKPTKKRIPKKAAKAAPKKTVVKPTPKPPQAPKPRISKLKENIYKLTPRQQEFVDAYMIRPQIEPPDMLAANEYWVGTIGTSPTTDHYKSFRSLWHKMRGYDPAKEFGLRSELDSGEMKVMRYVNGIDVNQWEIIRKEFMLKNLEQRVQKERKKITKLKGEQK